MLISKVLNRLFSMGSNIKVIRALKNYAVGTSGREVARIAGLSPKSCINTLSVLENIGIVNRIRGGRDHIFSLNQNHFLYSEAIIPLLNSEAKYFEAIKNDIIQLLKEKCKSVYVFGSVARNEDTPESDFDICVIMESQKQKQQLETEINKLKINAFIKYDINISPFYITEQEFINRIKINKSPVPDIIKDGILLFGKNIKNYKKW